MRALHLFSRPSTKSRKAYICAAVFLLVFAQHFTINYAQGSATSPQTLSKRAEWGKVLFFESRLSANGRVSCATCHEPQRAFTENKASSHNIEGHSLHRNAPTLINASHMDVLTWANPILKKLENQIIVPLFLDTPGEMALIRVWPKVRAEVLKTSPHIDLFRLAFPEESGDPDTRHLFSALAEYVRTLESFTSAYDSFLSGKTDAMAPDAQRGRRLFFSKRTNCAGCHSGTLFSNAAKEQFLSSKEPLALPPERGPQGRILQFTHNGLYNWDGKGGVPDKSEGLYEFSRKEEDRGVFRIPSLRNVALTPPYMHDGSIRTLNEVIEHYNRGGLQRCRNAKGCGRAPQTHQSIRSLHLTTREKKDLIAFLKSLSTSKSFGELGNP